SRERKYAEASEVYERIIGVDPQDAYAHEYLGYNLVRAGDDVSRCRRALEAYKRAVELETNNPLYRGRLLGLRAMLGEHVEDEISEGINEFIDSPIAVGWFVKPVLEGLKRGSRWEGCAELIRRWRALLEQSPKMREVLREDAHYSVILDVQD